MFAAALVAGGAVALGVNRLLELHLERQRPQVESEAIFVALRSLPGGAAVTVWDVALKPWPRATVPASAIRSIESYDGLTARLPLREGLPLLASQLSLDPEAARRTTAPAATVTGNNGNGGGDLWLPGESSAGAEPVARVTQPAAPIALSPAVIPEPALPEPVPVAVRLEPSAAVALSARTPTVPHQPTPGGSMEPPLAAPAVSADVDPPAAAVPTSERALQPTAPVIAVSPPRVADEQVARPTATVPLTPLLPADWSPSAPQAIAVPHRVALRGGGDTAAAVAAAVGATKGRRMPIRSSAADVESAVADRSPAARADTDPAEVATVSPPAPPAIDPVVDAVVDEPSTPSAAVATSEPSSAPVTRIVGAPLTRQPSAPQQQSPVAATEPSAANRKVVVAHLKPAAAAQPSAGQSTAGSAMPRPLPPTVTAPRSNAPTGNRPKPSAPSRGFQFPSIFGWSR